MALRSAIAVTILISVTPQIGHAGAQYGPIYGQASLPGPSAAIPDEQILGPAGTIIIDTPHTYLYLVLGPGRALRYGVGVGREGFTWAGTQRIARMVEWPDWHPPPEMIDRKPNLPRFMAGGPGNPLGARALYLGNTLYRIHGTNQPATIGQFVSSGCIRLLNEDIEDLYNRVTLGHPRCGLARRPYPTKPINAAVNGPLPAPSESGSLASADAAQTAPGHGAGL
jgi:lipoprotein-anchoring transpeptidase ErfK/SrfK